MVAVTALRTHPDERPLGVLVNDNALSGKPLDDTKQRLLAVFCALVAHMAEHKGQEERLRGYATILQAATTTARELLRSGTGERQVLTGLERIGRAAGVESAAIYEVGAPGLDGRSAHLSNRWLGGRVADAHSGSQDADGYWPRWLDQLRNGRAVYGSLEELPEDERPWLQAHGILSVVATPIFVTGELWGCLELAEYQRERQWSQFEVAALQLAADLLGASVQRHNVEQRLQRTMENLAQSNMELEQFAYVASHDLQEPLRMVASYVQLLGRRYAGKLDEDADEFIGYAVDGATRMQRLISDLLTYSRVSTQGRDLTQTDMARVMGTALSNLEMAIGDVGATVTHDELPSVVGDDGQLVQLMQNLMANALKFHGEEAPAIHVGVKQNGEHWVFSVTDNGIGMDPTYAERIFVIFQRLHSREKYPGTGIGLAICKRIVERHGGRIWVETSPSQGSTFRFTLRRPGADTV